MVIVGTIGGIAMDRHDDLSRPEMGVDRPRCETVHRMGEVLEELLAQFQRRFPDLGRTLVPLGAESSTPGGC